MRTLYVSQNGMAENLGQSQVLPYLRGLARRGLEIDLVSFELPDLAPERRAEIAADIERANIRWHPLARTMRAPLAVKMWEAGSGVAAALRLAVSRKPDIVHGRSYFATAVCDAVASAARRPKLLFDCRGMLGDEYVDCGYWTKDRIEYRMVKLYERRLFRRSDGVVVLTRALASWLRTSGLLGARPALEVVPCCVDMEKFRIDEDARARLRAELGVGDRVVLTYAGSLGTWYLEPEMARFAVALRSQLAAAGRGLFFACFTPSDATSLRAQLERAGFPMADVAVRKVPPPRMPEHLAIGDVGLSFIQSCFSKMGSSPTKVAEYLATGSVVVVNGDIGDQSDLVTEKGTCFVLDGFGEAELEQAARGVAEAVLSRPRAERAEAARASARKHFGLEEVGVARYARLYETLGRR